MEASMPHCFWLCQLTAKLKVLLLLVSQVPCTFLSLEKSLNQLFKIKRISVWKGSAQWAGPLMLCFVLGKGTSRRLFYRRLLLFPFVVQGFQWHILDIFYHPHSSIFDSCKFCFAFGNQLNNLFHSKEAVVWYDAKIYNNIKMKGDWKIYFPLFFWHLAGSVLNNSICMCYSNITYQHHM